MMTSKQPDPSKAEFEWATNGALWVHSNRKASNGRVTRIATLLMPSEVQDLRRYLEYGPQDEHLTLGEV